MKLSKFKENDKNMNIPSAGSRSMKGKQRQNSKPTFHPYNPSTHDNTSKNVNSNKSNDYTKQGKLKYFNKLKQSIYVYLQIQEIIDEMDTFELEMMPFFSQSSFSVYSFIIYFIVFYNY